MPEADPLEVARSVWLLKVHSCLKAWSVNLLHEAHKTEQSNCTVFRSWFCSSYGEKLKSIGINPLLLTLCAYNYITSVTGESVGGGGLGALKLEKQLRTLTELVFLILIDLSAAWLLPPPGRFYFHLCFCLFVSRIKEEQLNLISIKCSGGVRQHPRFKPVNILCRSGSESIQGYFPFSLTLWDGVFLTLIFQRIIPGYWIKKNS